MLPPTTACPPAQQRQRSRMGRIGLIALVAWAGLGNLPWSAPARAQASLQAPVVQPSSAISEARARSAAERILSALRNGDANARYAQFAPSLQRVSSPSMVAATISRQPKLLRWTITGVVPGVDSSTVEANLITSAGPRQILMVIDANGKLEGYHFNLADKRSEEVVGDFIRALSTGHYISASSFLSPSLQEEISQSQLQAKWQNLQRITGNFVQVKRIAPSESTADMKLVIVTVQFNRLTDNLFVLLDRSNQIISVDFPTDPAKPTPVR